MSKKIHIVKNLAQKYKSNLKNKIAYLLLPTFGFKNCVKIIIIPVFKK